MMKPLRDVDPEIDGLLGHELARQRNGLELIASENFVSRAVMEAVGSVAINKYAEGYGDKRYYGGCEMVNKIEQIAIDRAKQLFHAGHVNVQPHSGAQANAAVFLAFMKPGETVLGMDLQAGGHLTHGSPVNFSGLIYNAITYGVTDQGFIDYDQVRDQARENRPKIIIAGYSAHSRHIDYGTFAEIAKEFGAIFMVDMAHFAGLVATGHYPSPIPFADVVTTTTHKTLRGPRSAIILCKSEYADIVDKAVFPGTQGGPHMHTIAAKAVAFKEALEPSFIDYSKRTVDNARALAGYLMKRGFHVVSNGTDNHMMLVDLRNRNKELTGKAAEKALGFADITVNKNTVPRETASKFVTSGIRIGTPAVTTRGMGEKEMGLIAEYIDSVLSSSESLGVRESVRNEIKALCKEFPLYE